MLRAYGSGPPIKNKVNGGWGGVFKDYQGLFHRIRSLGLRTLFSNFNLSSTGIFPTPQNFIRLIFLMFPEPILGIV
jgi:hypothetical protein